jgi:hypothetical protein
VEERRRRLRSAVVLGRQTRDRRLPNSRLHVPTARRERRLRGTGEQNPHRDRVRTAHAGRRRAMPPPSLRDPHRQAQPVAHDRRH